MFLTAFAVFVAICTVLLLAALMLSSELTKDGK